MNLTLRNAADYVRTSRAPEAFLAIIRAFRRVFTFSQERTNRLARFVMVANAYRRGQPVRDIEAKYGCSRGTVLRYARLAGMPKRDRGFEPGIRDAVIALYLEGKPIAQIQAQLGVSQAYVSKTASEEGINRRVFRRRATSRRATRHARILPTER
jgi:uncharacterized protein YerC